jgi:hypothetical protein
MEMADHGDVQDASGCITIISMYHSMRWQEMIDDASSSNLIREVCIMIPTSSDRWQMHGISRWRWVDGAGCISFREELMGRKEGSFHSTIQHANCIAFLLNVDSRASRALGYRVKHFLK